MIALEDAQRLVLAACAPLGSEEIALVEAAGRVAARTLVAREDLVPFPRSAMDGFAVRADDTRAAPVTLAVRGTTFAGERAAAHAARSATAIATGAPIPEGADAVIPIEDVERTDGVVRIGHAVAPGTHVFPPGEDARAGDGLIEAHALVRPSALGLLASAGYRCVPVFRRPRVAIVVSGDELVAVEATPGPGQIRNSNAPLIAATLEALGAEVVACAQVSDDADALRRTFAAALAACDLLVTTGGASVGERDYTKAVLAELGVAFAFESVALSPAKPTAFGSASAAHVAVLPGNPSSAFIGLQEIARPALLALAGRRDPLLPRVRAALRARVHGKAVRTFAAYARVRLRDGAFVAEPLGNQCSSLTRSAAEADGFVIVPPGRGDLAAGAAVDVDVYDWTNVASDGSR